MIVDKNYFLNAVDDFLNNKQEEVHHELNKIKAYLCKDEYEAYVINDQNYSIKCFFDPKMLNEFIQNYPSDERIDYILDNSMILIKKFYFDILLIKRIDKCFSINVIIYIQDFEVDVSQKTKSFSTKTNINKSSKIISSLQKFLLNYSKKIMNDELQKNPFNFSAESFIREKFETDQENINLKYINLMPKDHDNILLISGLSLGKDANRVFREIVLQTEKSDKSDQETKIKLEEFEKINFADIFINNEIPVIKNNGSIIEPIDNNNDDFDTNDIINSFLGYKIEYPEDLIDMINHLERDNITFNKEIVDKFCFEKKFKVNNQLSI